jgi:hypothetical protein
MKKKIIFVLNEFQLPGHLGHLDEHKLKLRLLNRVLSEKIEYLVKDGAFFGSRFL